MNIARTIVAVLICTATGCGESQPQPRDSSPPRQKQNAKKTPAKAIDAVETGSEEDPPLSRFYLQKYELAKMAETDAKFAGAGVKNGYKEFVTARGTFRKVTSQNRWSIDPEARHDDSGWPSATYQLPNGKWVKKNRYVNFDYVLEVDKRLYLLGGGDIIEWVDNDTYFNKVFTYDKRSFGAPQLVISSIPNAEGIFVNAFQLHGFVDRKFAGLVVYEKGSWSQVNYEGSRQGYIAKAVKDSDDHYILTLKPSRGRPTKIVYDHFDRSF